MLEISSCDMAQTIIGTTAVEVSNWNAGGEKLRSEENVSESIFAINGKSTEVLNLLPVMLRVSNWLRTKYFSILL